MKPKRYNEFKVVWSKDRTVVEQKFPTKRGHVSIHDHEAKLMNDNAKNTCLLYELAEEPIKEVKTISIDEAIERDGLFKLAAERGLKIPKNISTEKLRTKLAE